MNLFPLLHAGSDAYPERFSLFQSVANSMNHTSDFMFSKRQIADALARGRKNSVADRRRHRRDPRLADSGERRVAFYQVYSRFNQGLVDPRDRIIVEVGLLDHTA